MLFDYTSWSGVNEVFNLEWYVSPSRINSKFRSNNDLSGFSYDGQKTHILSMYIVLSCAVKFWNLFFYPPSSSQIFIVVGGCLEDITNLFHYSSVHCYSLHSFFTSLYPIKPVCFAGTLSCDIEGLEACVKIDFVVCHSKYMICRANGKEKKVWSNSHSGWVLIFYTT